MCILVICLPLAVEEADGQGLASLADEEHKHMTEPQVARLELLEKQMLVELKVREGAENMLRSLGSGKEQEKIRTQTLQV